MSLSKEDLQAISELLKSQKTEIFAYIENVTQKQIDLIGEGFDGLRDTVDLLKQNVEASNNKDDINALTIMLNYHEDQISQHKLEIERIKKLLNVS